MANNFLKKADYFWLFSVKTFFFFLFLLGIWIFLLSDNFSVPFGYGGDLIGLDHYFRLEKVVFNIFAPLDSGLKVFANWITPSTKSPISILILLVLITHLVCSFVAVCFLCQVFSRVRQLQLLVFLGLILEPLSLSLLLSGHITFIPSMALLLSITCIKRKHSSLVFIGCLLLISLINLYLTIPFVLFYLVFSLPHIFLLKNKDQINRLIKNLIIILFFISLKCLLNFIDPELFTKNFLDASLEIRGNASGVFPLNFVIPDSLNIFSTFFLSLKNQYFQYLNIPESNYFFGYLPLFLLIRSSFLNFRDTLCAGTIYLLLLLFLAFPPHSDAFGFRIYFPSFFVNEVVPELRILSRNAASINIIFWLYFLWRHHGVWVKCRPLLFSLLLLQLPFFVQKISFMEPNYTAELKECGLNEGRKILLEKQSWDKMYCRKLEISPNLCQYAVLNTIDQQRNFEICKVSSVQ